MNDSNAVKRAVSRKGLLALALVVASGAALATGPTPIDVTDATEQLGTVGTTVQSIGSSLFVAAAIAVAVKWAKAAIFG